MDNNDRENIPVTEIPSPEPGGPTDTAPEPRKPARSVWLARIGIPVLIALVALGLYLIKNPPGGTAGKVADTGVFALDATADFDLDEILSHNLPVIIDFGYETCPACKELWPILVDLNKELRGRAVIKYVDVQKNTEVNSLFPLEVVPTQFFYNADGTPFTPEDESGFILYTLKSTGEHKLTAHQGGLDKETLLAILKEMGMQ